METERKDIKFNESLESDKEKEQLRNLGNAAQRNLTHSLKWIIRAV